MLDELWLRFMKTGKITDYILYKSKMKEDGEVYADNN